MNYYTYHFYVGRQLVHGGITTDPGEEKASIGKSPGGLADACILWAVP